jgi:hypothetical protein
MGLAVVNLAWPHRVQLWQSIVQAAAGCFAERARAIVVWAGELLFGGMLKGLTPQRRGPKSKRNPQEDEMQKLRRENQRLTELRKAEIIIDVQKKVGSLLGWPLPKADPEEQS